MRIARIAIARAELGSDGGVIDGCARVHWLGRAMFPCSAVFMDGRGRKRANDTPSTAGTWSKSESLGSYGDTSM